MAFNPHSPIGEDPSAIWEPVSAPIQQLLWCRALHEAVPHLKRNACAKSCARQGFMITIGLACGGSAFHQSGNPCALQVEA
jgi:hypothetical protein